MVIINLEPVYAILLSLIFFGKDELMSFDFYIGFVLILIAIFLDTLDKRKNRVKKLSKKNIHL